MPTPEKLHEAEHVELPKEVNDHVREIVRSLEVENVDPQKLRNEVDALNDRFKTLTPEQREQARMNIVSLMPETRLRTHAVVVSREVLHGKAAKRDAKGKKVREEVQTVPVSLEIVALQRDVKKIDANEMSKHIGDFEDSFYKKSVGTTSDDMTWDAASLKKIHDDTVATFPKNVQEIGRSKFKVLDALVHTAFYDQREVVRFLTVARKRAQEAHKTAQPTEEQILGALEPQEAREVVAATLRISRTELLARSLSQVDRMSKEYDSKLHKQGKPDDLKATREISERYRTEVTAAAIALTEHHMLVQFPERGQGWVKNTQEGQEWLKKRNKLEGWLQDLLRCEVKEYKYNNAERVPPLHVGILAHGRLRYNELFKNVKGTKRASDEREAFKKEGKQIVEDLGNWTKAMNEYQMTIIALGITRHQIFQRVTPNAGQKPSEGGTSETELEDFDTFMWESTKGSLDALRDHLKLVKEEVLVGGADAKLEKLWNEKGRAFVDWGMRKIKKALTLAVPTKVGKKLVEGAIDKALPPLLDWPLDDDGEPIPFKDLTAEQQKTLEKKMDSVLKAIQEFEAKNVLGKFEESRQVMEFLNTNHPDNDEWLSLLHENEKMPEDLLNRRLTPKDAEQLLTNAGNDRRRKAWIVKRCIEQFHEDGNAFNREYVELLNRIHEIIGIHFDTGGGGGIPTWLLYALGGAYAAGGAGGLTHYGLKLGKNGRMPTGASRLVALDKNPLKMVGKTLWRTGTHVLPWKAIRTGVELPFRGAMRIVNSPFAVLHRAKVVLSAMRQQGVAAGATQAFKSLFWEFGWGRPPVEAGKNALNRAAQFVKADRKFFTPEMIESAKTKVKSLSQEKLMEELRNVLKEAAKIQEELEKGAKTLTQAEKLKLERELGEILKGEEPARRAAAAQMFAGRSGEALKKAVDAVIEAHNAQGNVRKLIILKNAGLTADEILCIVDDEIRLAGRVSSAPKIGNIGRILHGLETIEPHVLKNVHYCKPNSEGALEFFNDRGEKLFSVPPKKAASWLQEWKKSTGVQRTFYALSIGAHAFSAVSNYLEYSALSDKAEEDKKALKNQLNKCVEDCKKSSIPFLKRGEKYVYVDSEKKEPNDVVFEVSLDAIDNKTKSDAALVRSGVDVATVASLLWMGARRGTGPWGLALEAVHITVKGIISSRERAKYFRFLNTCPLWLLTMVGSRPLTGETEHGLIDRKSGDVINTVRFEMQQKLGLPINPLAPLSPLNFAPLANEANLNSQGMREKLLFAGWMQMFRQEKPQLFMRVFGGLTPSPDAVDRFFEKEFKTIVLPQFKVHAYMNMDDSGLGQNIKWKHIDELDITGKFLSTLVEPEAFDEAIRSGISAFEAHWSIIEWKNVRQQLPALILKRDGVEAELQLLSDKELQEARKLHPEKIADINRRIAVKEDELDTLNVQVSALERDAYNLGFQKIMGRELRERPQGQAIDIAQSLQGVTGYLDTTAWNYSARELAHNQRKEMIQTSKSHEEKFDKRGGKIQETVILGQNTKNPVIYSVGTVKPGENAHGKLRYVLNFSGFPSDTLDVGNKNYWLADNGFALPDPQKVFDRRENMYGLPENIDGAAKRWLFMKDSIPPYLPPEKRDEYTQINTGRQRLVKRYGDAQKCKEYVLQASKTEDHAVDEGVSDRSGTFVSSVQERKEVYSILGIEKLVADASIAERNLIMQSALSEYIKEYLLEFQMQEVSEKAFCLSVQSLQKLTTDAFFSARDDGLGGTIKETMEEHEKVQDIFRESTRNVGSSTGPVEIPKNPEIIVAFNDVKTMEAMHLAADLLPADCVYLNITEDADTVLMTYVAASAVVRKDGKQEYHTYRKAITINRDVEAELREENDEELSWEYCVNRGMFTIGVTLRLEGKHEGARDFGILRYPQKDIDFFQQRFAGLRENYLQLLDREGEKAAVEVAEKEPFYAQIIESQNHPTKWITLCEEPYIRIMFDGKVSMIGVGEQKDNPEFPEWWAPYMDFVKPSTGQIDERKIPSAQQWEAASQRQFLPKGGHLLPTPTDGQLEVSRLLEKRVKQLKSAPFKEQMQILQQEFFPASRIRAEGGFFDTSLYDLQRQSQRLLHEGDRRRLNTKLSRILMRVDQDALDPAGNLRAQLSKNVREKLQESALIQGNTNADGTIHEVSGGIDALIRSSLPPELLAHSKMNEIINTPIR